MKISLITTVKNEQDSIQRFLDSIKKQTKKPDEIILVDGGSTDETISKIKNQMSKTQIKYKILEKKGNRSVGRNEAVKNSSNKIIVCTDAGCVLDKDWLKKITKPFEENSIDVVAGFYKPKTASVFEKCLATYTCVMPDKLDLKNFLPSSRSIAFRRSAWKKVGGYPEELDTCEDLVFAKRMKDVGLQFFTVRGAVVFWPQRKNILQAAKQFFLYAVGDGKAGYVRANTPYLFARYIIGILLVVILCITRSMLLFLLMSLLLLLYIVWSISKNYKYVASKRAYYILPMLQFTSDIAVIFGMIYGRLSRQNT